MAFQNTLPKKSEDLSEWYNKVILMAELADYGPAKGTMIFRPYGYRIWELVQEAMDRRIKEKGIDNAYFPLFIPESFLKKEQKHVEGFAPELAVVTIGGGEELEEKLVVRPTSETIMYDAYSRWVQSWRDLPILINQWSNAVRWEKRTYLFMRTTEFLWQEGHTAHATHEEAVDLQKWAIEMYTNIYRDYFAMTGYVGYKSVSETFAGADRSISLESLMPGGKALQSCTSHDLGQNFSKAFNVSFQNKEGKTEYVWQTSWGFSTRSLGGLFLTHGDDRGLVLPPKLAQYQVVILPVKLDDEILDYCGKLATDLKESGIRVLVDRRDGESIGFKQNKWELKGAPIRIAVGSKEIESGELSLIRRDTGEIVSIKCQDLPKIVEELLTTIQADLLVKAEEYLKANTRVANSYDEFKEIMNTTKGFIKALWCEDPICEEKIKEETKATTRCLPLDTKVEEGVCVYCAKPAKHRWIFAQAY